MISHLLSTICHVTTFLLAEIPEHVLGIVKPMSKVSASDCGVVRFTILQERAPTTLRLASGIFMCTTKQRNILSCVLYRLEYTSFTWDKHLRIDHELQIHTTYLLCRDVLTGYDDCRVLVAFDPLPRVISRLSSSSRCYIPLLMSTVYLHGYLVCRP